MSENNFKRRGFLQKAGLGIIGLSLPTSFYAEAMASQNNNDFMMYVGTYTNTKSKSDGIYLYKLNAATGQLSLVGTTKGIENPSYLAIDAQRRHLFAANEITEFEGKPSGAVSAFTIDSKTGNLTFLNKQASLGGAPCYITVDKSGKFVLAANYVGGNVVAFPVQANGQLGAPSANIQHKGSSVNKKRQEGPHAHCIVFDAANKYAFAVDLGLDKIQCYQFDANKGTLILKQSTAVKAGSGPRHITFHPNGKQAYVISELNSTVTAFAYNQTSGVLQELQTISTLPEGFSGESYCADIHVSPNGKFLYGSNRGHNSIVVYAIDANTGKLTYVENVSTEGKWPRNFTIDPTGKLLLVANQNTDNIVSFRIDNQSGKLSPTGQTTQVPAPVCLQIIPAFS